jgi:ABC-type sugar transport system ATPase subunit
MASLSLHALEKSFGGQRVVDAVSLDIADGEFVVLVGPSGCGKSTLLRLIAGLEQAEAGEIRLDGERIDQRQPAERDIAMVFQSYALYPHMSVARNIAFPLRMAGVARAEREARTRAAAGQVGISELLGRKPAQLSGGQQQRVALARALVRRPRLFLFDEPLSNVDAKLRAEMRAELGRLHAELGATMVHVTHDQIEAMTLGTRIVVLDQGRVQQSGTPLEVYRRPRNTFVAGFLGSPPMNLLRDETRVVGFRPHDVRVGGPLRLGVELVEPLGQETLVHGTLARDEGLGLPGGAAVLVLAPDVPVTRGATFEFDVPAQALHRFDPGSGERQQ